jgi:hypothetical protein
MASFSGKLAVTAVTHRQRQPEWLRLDQFAKELHGTGKTPALTSVPGAD